MRASQEPILNWGDPSNLDNFIIHVTGQTYGVYFSAIKESLHRLIPHLVFFPSQFTKYILCVSLLAIPILLWRRITIFLFFSLIFVTNAIHSIRYTIVNIQDYYLPSFILLAILIGFGLSFITRLIPKFLKPISILFLLLPLIPYHTNYFQNNRTKFYFAYDYGMNILKPLKEDAIIFSYGDYDTFPSGYLLYTEERRRDISALCWTFLTCDWHIEPIERDHPAVSFPFEKIAIKDLRYHNLNEVRRDRLKKIVLANLEKFPVYSGSGVKDEAGIQKNYLFLPDGVFFRLLPKTTDKEGLKIGLKKGLQFFLRGINDKSISKDRVASKIIDNYSLSYNDRGNLWQGIDIDRAITDYKNGLAITPSYPPSELNLGFAYVNKKDYEKAMEIFRKVAKENPDYNPSLLHYGFGLVYQNKGMPDKARQEYKIALKIDPNNTYAKQGLEGIK
ncbi:tetratricopeptide repeat protein [bacterium]|nr:tetratricopeptide repeat protein [bacterium]